MKPQGPIVTAIPESNRANNCDILNLVSNMLDLTYRGLLWYGTMKNETGNLVEKLRDNTISKVLSAKIISMLNILGAKIL